MASTAPASGTATREEPELRTEVDAGSLDERKAKRRRRRSGQRGQHWKASRCPVLRTSGPSASQVDTELFLSSMKPTNSKSEGQSG